MDVNDLAAQLDKSEYPVEIPKALEIDARAAGVVIVFGNSDDLMEFRGAIDDEVSAYEGAEILVDAEGLVPAFEQIDKERHDAKDRLREFFRRENAGKIIKAIWAEPTGTYSWTYETTIPHATFEVVEGGEPYCRGIVFALKDCA